MNAEIIGRLDSSFGGVEDRLATLEALVFDVDFDNKRFWDVISEVEKDINRTIDDLNVAAEI